MGWNYPEISFEEMVKLIKGFVDILILASGYQSSGLFARWDSHNIKKALHWGFFFEKVFNHLSSSDVYLESLKELDATLNEMTSNPSFPQGLSDLSSATLSRARAFVAEHFIRALPLRDVHLRDFLTATTDLDLNKLSETEHDGLNLYLNRLTLLDSSLSLVQEPRSSLKDSIMSSSYIAPNMEIDECIADDFTTFAVQGLLKRQSVLSCLSTVKKGLDILSSAVKLGSCTESGNDLIEEHLKLEGAPALMGTEDQLIDIVTWNRWKTRNFSYFIDMRTVRLVSGASMIFSAPKCQWVQLFEQLHISAEGSADDLIEIIELLLCGCITSKWSCLIEHFMSVSYDALTIPEQYHEVCKRIGLHSTEDMNSKEISILEHLIEFLSGQLHQLWKVPPALIAVSIPSWSPLFGWYLSEVETQFKGDNLTIRCCSCTQDGKEHKDCELAERIWLLYIFHCCGLI